jgi:hypothetical protein
VTVTDNERWVFVTVNDGEHSAWLRVSEPKPWYKTLQATSSNPVLSISLFCVLTTVNCTIVPRLQQKKLLGLELSDERRAFGVAGSNGHACEPTGHGSHWRRPDHLPSFPHGQVFHPSPSPSVAPIPYNRSSMLAAPRTAAHSSHYPAVSSDPLNINYDSDEDMEVDSDSDAKREQDIDADGEFEDDPLAPLPVDAAAARPSSSSGQYRKDSVRATILGLSYRLTHT